MDEFLRLNVDLLAEVFWGQLGFSTATAHVAREAEYWAYEDLESALTADSDTALEIIDALIRTAPNEAALALVGAGPVAEVLALYGEEGFHRLQAHARFDVRYRSAIAAAIID